MNNYEKFFEKELKILKENMVAIDDSKTEVNIETEDNHLIIEDYIDIIKKITRIFSKQGHSGNSAPFYSSILSDTIKKVLNFEPLSPITGNENEWDNNIDKDLYQNKRLSSLFKNNTQSKSNKNRKISEKPYYIDAIIWQDEDGIAFTGQVEDIASYQYIKCFPFTPKKFYIDVYYEKYDETKHKNEIYTKGDDGKYITRIKNRNQLKEVEKYYDMLEQLKELNPKKYNKTIRKIKLEKIDENTNS